MGSRESALAAVIVLSACAGTPFTIDDTTKVHNGMTEAEVIAVLGKPYSRTTIDGSTAMLTWSFAMAFGSARAATYRFKDGVVVGSGVMGK